MSTKEAIRVEKVRRIYGRRDFPKHYAGWSIPRMVTDGNHQPGQSQGPQHSKGWHPKTEREDIYWQGRAGTGKHRRNPKHKALPSDYAIPHRVVLGMPHPSQQWRVEVSA